MNTVTPTSWRAVPLKKMQSADWPALVAVLALALVLRLLFYTGTFGSDEVTYIQTAANIAAGDWRASSYIGATRYGMNLPIALSIYVFGLSEFSANLWPFLCSIAEVGVVFVIARWLWGQKVAVLSSAVLALLPLHVNFAGRMLADPPLAFFLTLSVALLLRAAYSRDSLTYIFAGLAWGGVFWVKESVGLLYLPVFLFLTLFLSRITGRLLWVVAGMCMAVIVNCVLMNFIAGNPMHVFDVMKTAVFRIANIEVETSPWYYLKYLFINIKHTYLLGPLATAGVVTYLVHALRKTAVDTSTPFVILWAFLLIGMFSFAIVSFTPVKLVMKQFNYILIFAGPLALLGGWFLATLSRRLLAIAGILVVSGSVVLAALSQQAATVFTANSKAAYLFLRERPTAYLVGTTSNIGVINFYSLMHDRLEMRTHTLPIGDMTTQDISEFAKNQKDGGEVFVVVDLQSFGWLNKQKGIKKLSDVPTCWTALGTLKPEALGAGHWVAKGLVAAGTLLPANLKQRYLSVLQPVSSPEPAYLFKVDYACPNTPDAGNQKT